MYPNVTVVGMHFRGREAVDLAKSLEPGVVLRLVREAENPYDGNAVKVLFEDMHIGYLERDQAAWIAPDMDDSEVQWAAEVTGQEERPTKGGKINYHPVVTVRHA